MRLGSGRGVSTPVESVTGTLDPKAGALAHPVRVDGRPRGTLDYRPQPRGSGQLSYTPVNTQKRLYQIRVFDGEKVGLGKK